MNILVIPSLNPPESFYSFVSEISRNDCFAKIIIIDDGSSQKEIFRKINDNLTIQIITNNKNRGKGYSIKKSINYILKNKIKTNGVIFADCDGQHSVKDILKLNKLMNEDPKSFYIGKRVISSSNMPLMNFIGNYLSSNLFKFITKKNVSDINNGLRGIPFNLLHKFLNSNHTKFSYEIHILKKILQHDIVIKELEIETIYQKNYSTNFKKISDSIKIIWSIIF